MANRIVTQCPFCNKPHTVTISEFENTAPFEISEEQYTAPRRQSVWAESIRYATWLVLSSGTVTLALAMSDLRTPPYWVAPVAGLGITLLPELVKLWLTRPIVITEPKPKQTSIRLEMSESLPAGKRYLLADLDEAISIDDLAIVGQADAFTRAAVTKAGLSQGKFHKVKNEFLRLNLAYPLPNNANGYGLTLRGKALLRQAASLPHSPQ